MATSNDVSFLALLMKNAKSKPDIDFDAVAKELKITPKSAKERFRLLGIKLGWKDDPKSPSTPKKPTGVTKRASAKVGTKSAQKGGKGKKAEAATTQDADDSEEMVTKDDESDEITKAEP
ncbi:hypothetical protein diail_8902, partial [Diaporthe ilicicola]